MTYIFRPGGYNVTDAATAMITPQFGGAALPWWNPDGATPSVVCGAWQAKGAASLAASYLNLATLGNANIDPAIVGGIAPTWNAADGWTFNGLTQYLISGFIPTVTASFLIRYSNAPALDNDYPIGVLYTVPNRYWGFATRRPTGSQYYIWGNTANAIGLFSASGVAGIAANNAYFNGLSVGVLPALWNADPPTGPFFGALNLNGVSSNYCNAFVQCVAVYSGTLTAPQVLARATAMAAL